MIYRKEKKKEIKLISLIKEIKDFIKESPVVINRTVGDRYDDPVANKEIRQDFINLGGKKVGQFRFHNNVYDIYGKEEDNKIFFALLDEEYIMLSFDVEPVKIKNLNGVSSLSVVQSRIGDRSVWQEIAKTFVFDYLLKNYDFILSDQTHTPLGKLFWKGMISKKLNELYCYAVDFNASQFLRLTNLNQFETYYTPEYAKVRFIISNKEITA